MTSSGRTSLDLLLLRQERGMPARARAGMSAARWGPRCVRGSAYNRRTVVPVRDSLRRLRANPSTLPLAIIGLAILAVNLPTLLDLVTRNPVQMFAYLQSGSGHQILPGSSIIDPNAGYITMAMGHLAAMDWLHGHIPWWNPYEGLGAPLAGEMQAAAFFPLVLLLEGSLGFVVFHIVLELVAGYATYFLLRRLGLGRAASTAGGVAFGLCGTLAWFEHATANPVAFLPLALLGVERARAASVEMRANGWRLLAVALALSIVSGFPEVAYLDGLLVALWAAVRLFSLPARRQFMLGEARGGWCGRAPLERPGIGGLHRLPAAWKRREPRRGFCQRFPGDSKSGADGPPLQLWAHLRIAGGRKLVTADVGMGERRRVPRRDPDRLRTHRASR